MGTDADCCDACRDRGSRDAAREVTAITGGAVRVVITHGGVETVFVPTSSRVTIGRRAGNDIAIADSTLGREHCILRISPTRVTIEDATSPCGTYVDGFLSRGETAIDESSVVTMGNTRLRVERVTCLRGR